VQALSNQKLLEMRAKFGHARCGLQTGDSSLNTEADIVIMTTEILRNIMWVPGCAPRDRRCEAALASARAVPARSQLPASEQAAGPAAWLCVACSGV